MRIEGLAPRGGKHEGVESLSVRDRTDSSWKSGYFQTRGKRGFWRSSDRWWGDRNNKYLAPFGFSSCKSPTRSSPNTRERTCPEVCNVSIPPERSSTPPTRETDRRTGGARADGKPLSLPNDRRPRFPSLSFLEDSLIKMGPSN